LAQSEFLFTTDTNRDDIGPSSARQRDESRRRNPRVRTNFEIRLCSEDARYSARCTSLSLCGMFVETDLRLGYESAVRLELTVNEGLHVMRLEGVVRWLDARGFGVQFGPVGASETHALSALIERARHQPSNPQL
jgi:hypothetical protein